MAAVAGRPTFFFFFATGKHYLVIYNPELGLTSFGQQIEVRIGVQLISRSSPSLVLSGLNYMRRAWASQGQLLICVALAAAAKTNFKLN